MSLVAPLAHIPTIRYPVVSHFPHDGDVHKLDMSTIRSVDVLQLVFLAIGANHFGQLFNFSPIFGFFDEHNPVDGGNAARMSGVP